MDIPHLVEFTSEAFWSWAFFCGKFYDYECNLFTCYKVYSDLLFPLESVW